MTGKPYKVLSCFVYDWSFVPLKRREFDTSKVSPKPKKKRAARQVNFRSDVTSKDRAGPSGLSKRKDSSDMNVLTKEDEQEFKFPSHR